MKAELTAVAIAAALVVATACNQPASQPGTTADANAPAGAAPAAGSAAAPGGAPSGSAGSGSVASTASPSREKAAEKSAPTMMAMDIAAGTPLEITLDTPVSSESSNAEDTVRGKVAKAVVVSGMTVIPAGALVKGTVVSAERAGRVKGRASVALRFNEVVVASTPYKIQTTRIVREAEATKGEDAKKIGIGAGVGTAIGAIAGGKKGAAIGAGVGAGAGTGAVLATRGEEVRIPAGATLRTKIDEAVRINAPM
jgi:hypothetical protein